MTVIDELLVLLDDGVERTLDECAILLPRRTKQTLSSTLGRLAGKGWIEVKRDRLRSMNSYMITERGSSAVTTTLRHLKIAGDDGWDGRWLFILFNIPERQRKYRDILRNRLTSIGCGRVQNSLWATARDVRFELDDLMEEERIRRCVTMLRPTLADDDATQLASAFEWDWEQLNGEYHAFIEESDQFLRTRDRDPFQAKLLVYRYASLLQQDPKFPSHLEPRSYLRSKAHVRYEKVRPYCYTD